MEDTNPLIKSASQQDLSLSKSNLITSCIDLQTFPDADLSKISSIPNSPQASPKFKIQITSPSNNHSLALSSNSDSDSEENSENSSESEKPVETPQSQVPLQVFQYRKKSKMDYTIKPIRANYIKEHTIGLSTQSPQLNFKSMKLEVKKNKDFAMKIFKKFKDIDNNVYEKFLMRKVFEPEVSNVFNQFYKLRKKYAGYAITFFMNSYDEDGICRIFESFFLEFDSNFDRKIEMKELVKCIELLAKEKYVGEEKMRETLKEIGVFVSDSIAEGDEARRLFSDQTYLTLFEKFSIKLEKRASVKTLDFIDFHKFAPLIFIFFLEFIVKLNLSRSDACRCYIGIPQKANKKGKLTFDPSGSPDGLYQIFIKFLEGEADIKKAVVTYETVTRSLIAYRTTAQGSSLTMESVERILGHVKNYMGVDVLTHKESRKYTMKELLPYIASKVLVETAWNKIEYKKSIEQYDDSVIGLGGTLSTRLKKKKLDKLLNEAFCFLPFPNYEQFVKGLDFILHRAIPTLVSPAAIFIANGLVNTPDAVIVEDSADDTKKILFDIQFIIKHDDIFERLYYFTFNIQYKVSIVRLLYKNQLSDYKRTKNINKFIHVYNDILKNNELFEDTTPGKFGKFEDSSLNLVKLKDPKALKKEAKLRKEMKMRRYLELLFHRDKKLTEKQQKKRQVFKRTPDFSHQVKDQKKLLKSRLLTLQVEANKIDEKIKTKQKEKQNFLNSVKESSAFPNSSEITPEIIMNFIRNSNNKSKEVEDLERFIYTEKEKINFQDIHKFIVSEHLKRISDGGTDDVMSFPTKYTLENWEEMDENSFEEKYFNEVSKRRQEYFKVDYPVVGSTRKRVKDCCCVIA